MRILIAEDEVGIAKALKLVLEKNRFAVDMVHNGLDALEYMLSVSYDAVVLDIMMPGLDGLEVLKRAREKGVGTPVLFLTAKAEVEDRIAGLDAGADDYLTKPFRYPVLQAHMEAVLRRMNMGGAPLAEDISFGPFVLSMKEHALMREDERIALSPTEFELLVYFWNHQGTVLGFEEIYHYIWKKPSCGDLRTVFSHVRNLRKKIEKNPSEPRYIQTVPRVGYRFEANPQG